MTLAPVERPSSPCQAPDVDPDWWTSDQPSQVAAAVQICHRCPEEQACLIWAFRTRQRGPAVFGGRWFAPRSARRAS